MFLQTEPCKRFQLQLPVAWRVQVCLEGEDIVFICDIGKLPLEIVHKLCER